MDPGRFSRVLLLALTAQRSNDSTGLRFLRTAVGSQVHTYPSLLVAETGRIIDGTYTWLDSGPFEHWNWMAADRVTTIHGIRRMDGAVAIART